MISKEKNKEIVNKTTHFTKCKNCGHTRDWHQKGDLFYQQIFGIKLGKCEHYPIDYTLPFWKRRKIYCDCKEFVPRLDK